MPASRHNKATALFWGTRQLFLYMCMQYKQDSIRMMNQNIIFLGGQGSQPFTRIEFHDLPFSMVVCDFFYMVKTKQKWLFNSSLRLFLLLLKAMQSSEYLSMNDRTTHTDHTGTFFHDSPERNISEFYELGLFPIFHFSRIIKAFIIFLDSHDFR